MGHDGTGFNTYTKYNHLWLHAQLKGAMEERKEKKDTNGTQLWEGGGGFVQALPLSSVVQPLCEICKLEDTWDTSILLKRMTEDTLTLPNLLQICPWRY